MTAVADRMATPRLVLRSPRSDDAPRLARLIGAADVAHFLAGVPYPYAERDAEAWIARVGDPAAEILERFVILPGEGLIGAVGAHRLTPGGDLELGFWIGRDWWGHGFATEAAATLIAALFQGSAIRGLASGHFADNARSARVLAKLGFRSSGVERSRHSAARGVAVAHRNLWLCRADWDAGRRPPDRLAPSPALGIG
ncbi:MAG: GNAT family N-acetyltransferase [Paracoccaceae bacterium]